MFEIIHFNIYKIFTSNVIALVQEVRHFILYYDKMQKLMMLEELVLVEKRSVALECVRRWHCPGCFSLYISTRLTSNNQN